VVDNSRGDRRPKDYMLVKSEQRCLTLSCVAFVAQPRNPVTIVPDGVRQNNNLGAIFRVAVQQTFARLHGAAAR